MKFRFVKQTIVVAGTVTAIMGLVALGVHSGIGRSAPVKAGAVASEGKQVRSKAYGCRYKAPRVCLKRSGKYWKVTLQNKTSKTVRGKPALQFHASEGNAVHRFKTRSIAPRSGYQSSLVKCPRGYEEVKAGFLDTKGHLRYSASHVC